MSDVASEKLSREPVDTRDHSPTALRRWLSGEVTELELAVLLLLPAGVLILSVVLYPLGRMVWLSLHSFVLTRPGDVRFIGLGNFVNMLTDESLHDSLRVAAIYAAGSIVFPTILGMIMALVVNKTFSGRWVARLAVIMPWAMPRSLSAVIWSWLLQPTSGVLNDILMRTGAVSSPVNWLGDANLAMVSLILATTWKTAAFVALILLAGLQSIPEELYESASLDGASGTQKFLHVTLPLLRPHLLIALIFRTLNALQNLDFPFALTQGGPGTATRPLSMYVHRVTLGHLNFGYGAALALLMIVISLALTLWYMRVLRSR